MVNGNWTEIIKLHKPLTVGVQKTKCLILNHLVAIKRKTRARNINFSVADHGA